MSATASSAPNDPMSAAARLANNAAQPGDYPIISHTAVAAAVAINALEFYDFITYAFFAVYIGKTFFPVGGETGSLLASVATFGVGFFTRPLGGILIGAFADRVGRKPAMILTVTLITVGTLGLAATPSYVSIGIAAPIIVVFCRLLQGLALGGEVGPSSSLLIEAAPTNRRGLYASWQIASQGAAVMVAGLLGVLVSAWLSVEDMAAWGWRVPFLLSLVLVPIAVYVRRNLPETLSSKSKKTTSQIVGSVIKDHTRHLVLGILVMMSSTVSTQFGNYMTTYAIHTLKLPPVLAQSNTVLGGLMTFVFALISGSMCDRYGRKPLMVVPRVALTILIVPMFYWLNSADNAITLLLVTAILTILTAAGSAASLVLIPELMPFALRSTGTSIIYAVGATVFGGTTQFIITLLMEGTKNPVSPAYYVVATGSISLIAMFMVPETKNIDITR